MGDRKVAGPGARILRNELITVSDGTKLAADIWIPEAADGRRFPCIAAHQPYHKDDVGGAVVFNRFASFFAEKGYCFALVDMRGTGSSEGCSTQPYSRREQEDGYELVEWLASQGWCDGGVGMIGWSHDSLSCLLTASMAPPHLKTVVTIYGGSSRFGEAWDGGSLSAFHHIGYLGCTMAAMNCMPPSFRDPEGRWFRIWEERMEKNVPWAFDYFETKDATTVDSQKVRTPTFIISSWSDLGVRRASELYSSLTCPKKLVIGPWLVQEPDTSVLGPRLDYHPTLLRWFDHWLKGEQNGVMDEAPVLVYTTEFTPTSMLRQDSNPWVIGTWKRLRDWPPDVPKPMDLYFHREGAMKPDVPEFDGGVRFFVYDPSKGKTSGLLGGVYSQTALPVDQAEEEGGTVVYETAPLTSAVEVNGSPEVEVAVESSAKTAALSVKLCEESAERMTALVASGYLNLSMRDPSGEPAPISRHEVYRIKVRLNPISHLFSKHHKIKLIVSGADFPHKWPTPDSGVIHVHFGKRYMSRLVLPAVSLGVHRTAIQSPPPPKPIQEGAIIVSPDEWTVRQDMREGGATVEWSKGTRCVLGLGSTIDQKWEIREATKKETPAETRLDANYTAKLATIGSTVEMKSKLILQSDRDWYFMYVGLDVDYDGAPLRRAVWTEFYPRSST